MGKQAFKCNNCKSRWVINKKRGIDYNQICQNCNSKYVIRSGIQNGKQGFQCKNCKKCWSVPIIDLEVKRTNNDLRYERVRDR